MTFPQFSREHSSLPETSGAAVPPSPPRSYLVSALLAFFLGEFGVHNFYLGYRSRAITQLGLYIVGWIFSFVLIGIPIVIAVHIWAFVDFVLILLRAGTYATDPYGRELT